MTEKDCVINPGPSTRAAFRIDRSRKFQIIEGFGGAFTEAGGFVLNQLQEEQRKEILRDYFDPSVGLGYTLCRTHIGSCDFSLGNYSYDDVEGDTDLRHFDISRDRKHLLPFIKDAMTVSGACFRLVASPWSPPAWMKSNRSMNHGGKLLNEYRQAWAGYYCKYIEEYAKEGVPIWAITVQNEPEATQTWESCRYSAEEERDFLKCYLTPALVRAGLSHVKVLIWDHNRDHLYDRAQTILSDPETYDYVWGVGFHWYEGGHFQNVLRAAEKFPDKKLLMTEACVECREQGVGLHDWSIGERYGYNIISDLNSGAVGWIDWNMVLDDKGGPNHVGNYCNAPVIVNYTEGKIHRESSFYYLGHFSKYVRPGAVRLNLESSPGSGLEAIAFDNADGSTIAIFLNMGDEKENVTLEDGDYQVAFECPAHSITTFVH